LHNNRNHTLKSDEVFAFADDQIEFNSKFQSQ